MNADQDRPELREQYRLAVEEYRFQVELNWRRSEYFFVLNIGVLVAGATLLASEDVPRSLVALVFGLGALLALLSFLANDTQRSYYRAARDRKGEIEERLEVTELAIATTPGMGSRLARLGRVGTFLKTMLIAIACVDLTGAWLAVADGSEIEPQRSQLVIKVSKQSREQAGPVVVVVSRDDDVIATRSGPRGRSLEPIGLEPGQYRAWTTGARICSRAIGISSAPLQQIELSCGRGR